MAKKKCHYKLCYGHKTRHGKRYNSKNKTLLKLFNIGWESIIATAVIAFMKTLRKRYGSVCRCYCWDKKRLSRNQHLIIAFLYKSFLDTHSRQKFLSKRLERSRSWNQTSSLTRRTGELDRTHCQTRRSGELGRTRRPTPPDAP